MRVKEISFNNEDEMTGINFKQTGAKIVSQGSWKEESMKPFRISMVQMEMQFLMVGNSWKVHCRKN